MKARLYVDKEMILSEVDERVFGSFIEHLGRAVYDGIYSENHPEGDENHFRRDVGALIRELGVSVIRYPGGNFVSGYRWEDGVGPQKDRPARLDLAWRSLESNRVGIDEFASWAKGVGSEVLLAVNLGTRGMEDACNLLEYCNHPGGSLYSDMRIRNGHKAPHAIKTWCLGNEMDGPWQIGHKTMEEYGRLALETARAMKALDPSIELVSCGSSGLGMPTFPEWEAETLLHTYEAVDYVSLHTYYGNERKDSQDYMACSDDMDRFIRSVIAACDYVKARKRGKKDIHLSFDEWNVWYHSKPADEAAMKNRPWQTAPSLLEDIYTFEDALLVGLMLITLLKHADRVKIACLAQLVNVIAPIMTVPGGGPCWKQTIYYPFFLTAAYGKGEVIRPMLRSPRVVTSRHDEIDSVEAVCVYNREVESLNIFAVNRNLSEDVELSVVLGDFGSCSVMEHLVLEHEDLSVTNGPDREHVAPRSVRRFRCDGGEITGVLKKASWNLIRLQGQGREGFRRTL